MPVKWDPEMDRLLLLQILQAHELVVDAKKVAAIWPNDRGEKPSARAITERLVVLRRNVKASGAEGGFSISSSQTKDKRTLRKSTKRKRDPSDKAARGVDYKREAYTPTKRNTMASNLLSDSPSSTGFGRIEEMDSFSAPLVKLDPMEDSLTARIPFAPVTSSFAPSHTMMTLPLLDETRQQQHYPPMFVDEDRAPGHLRYEPHRTNHAVASTYKTYRYPSPPLPTSFQSIDDHIHQGNAPSSSHPYHVRRVRTQLPIRLQEPFEGHITRASSQELRSRQDYVPQHGMELAMQDQQQQDQQYQQYQYPIEGTSVSSAASTSTRSRRERRPGIEARQNYLATCDNAQGAGDSDGSAYEDDGYA